MVYVYYYYTNPQNHKIEIIIILFDQKILSEIVILLYRIKMCPLISSAYWCVHGCGVQDCAI